ncbi:MAG TPA: AbrB family transcriptional regulator, partial [Dongiaceae bacterium]
MSSKAIPFRPERKHIIGHEGVKPLLLAIVIGTVGGFVFNWLKMPLAWMLGACVFSTIAAFAGLRIGMRVRLRQGMIIIMGVLLGSGFTPDLVQQLGKWAVSLCVLTGMTMTGATLGYFWFRRFTNWDKVTCYFAAMPGGLNDMTIMGGAMGGEERSIALAHALRILTVVLTIPVWYRLVQGATTSVLTMPHPANNDWRDWAVLIACGLIGAALGRLLRLPAAFMIGPMLMSAIAHLAGFTSSKPPGELVAAAQVVVGCGIGCRFVGTALDQLHKEIGASI